MEQLPSAEIRLLDRTNHHHRLPFAAVRVLDEWMQAHQGRPYPTKSEKVCLQRMTNLTARQLDTWFANARRRRPTHSGNEKRGSRDKTSVATNADHCQSNASRTNASRRAASVCADNAIATSLGVSEDEKIFHCTFCTESFTTKYNWTRHETSVHLPLKRFICCPTSPIRQDLVIGCPMCTYCNLQYPSSEHVDSHSHNECQVRPPEARVFSRADHLRQHLKWVHNCDFLPHMDEWLLEAEYVNSRCGFCGERFTRWTARNDHIAMHYKTGCKIDSWRGCRGLDSAVSTQVLAAMPPFLIGVEKQRKHASESLCTSIGPRSSCAENGSHDSTLNSRLEVLVRELQTLVMHYSAQGHSISDQALRYHARSINSVPNTFTAADNPEWLDLFKRAYSLDILPVRRSLPTARVADDLEVYHDLGLRIPDISKHREKSLHVLFQSCGPVEKTDRRLSSIAIPIVQTLPFETISEPWPDAGVLGSNIVSRDQIFSGVVRLQIRHPIIPDCRIVEECRQLPEDGNKLIELQDDDPSESPHTLVGDVSAEALLSATFADSYQGM